MASTYRPYIPIYGEDDFEWHDEKSAVTFDKRDMVFVAARIAFRGRLLRRQDTRREYGEPRYQVLGEVYGRILMIVYTPRGKKCHIITMRRATPEEEAIYYDSFT
jgi:uncharacterized DUF497 family protein